MLVSIKGALLKWVSTLGVMHTRYFGHWSDNSKQNATPSTNNMHCKPCIDGEGAQLVEDLRFAAWSGRGWIVPP